MDGISFKALSNLHIISLAVSISDPLQEDQTENTNTRNLNNKSHCSNISTTICLRTLIDRELMTLVFYQSQITCYVKDFIEGINFLLSKE